MRAGIEKQICQVAFTALNGPALREWYAHVFGLVKSGKVIFFPPSTANVQGRPGAWETCGWLLDQQDYFQLEFFQVLTPRRRMNPDNWRPCDIGYNTVGIAVNDFDQVLRKVSALSAIDPPATTGRQGARRACVSDPEGNLVEIYEQDPLTLVDGANTHVLRPEVPAVVRSMRVSVPSLEDARHSFVDAMGLQPVAGFQLHTAEDEASWGLPDARAKTLLVRSANFLVELVEYLAPEPQRWPAGYRISDQGFMNIALGYRDTTDYDRSFERAISQGMRPNGKVTDIGVFRVMYVNDPEGFSIEMLNARRRFWSISGFNSHEPYVEVETDIRAPADEVWQELTNHAGMDGWTIFDCSILREGQPDPYGTGCIRELTAPGLRITEEITAWDEERRHYAYQLRTGAPFRKHQGDVFVSEKNGLTRVRWAIRFDCWLPFTGRLTAWLLGLLFNRALKKLGQRVEARQPYQSIFRL